MSPTPPELEIHCCDGCHEPPAPTAASGATAALPPPRVRDEASVTRERRLKLALTILSGLCALSGVVTHRLLTGGWEAPLGVETPGVAHGAPPLPAALLYLVAVVAGGWFVAPRALRALRRFRPDMNLLMTLAVGGALVLGDWFEAATVAFLFALSLALEAMSVGRARQAVARLMTLAPAVARVRDADGRVVERPPDEVPVGTHLLVRPGDRIPLDARILDGAGMVDQSAVTGESRPVAKAPGDTLFAGTVNGDATFELETTRAASDSMIQRIVRLVGQAHRNRAPVERWIDRFAAVYTPVVLGVAFLTAFGPPLITGKDAATWAYRGLVLLVIGCPCALVISIPVSILAGLAAAAHRGVLIKGGEFLERAATLRAVAFDKTGTLTEGRPRVVEVVPFNGHSQRELLERATALESGAHHPMARAVLAEAERQGITPAPVTDYQRIPGKGASGRYNGRGYWLGSHRYLEERGQETPEVHDRLEALAETGHSVVVVGNDAHVCGFIAVADGLRPEARAALAELRRAGIPDLVLLTGDNAGTARTIAAEAGIAEIRADLLPEDKVSAVTELVRRHGSVAMVGDGVNDAPALARATIGIAMGAAGSDAALETADVALMSDDLTRLPWLVRHARRTRAIIRQNIGLALAVKIAFALWAVVGGASLWAAIVADMGASLLVIGNGLRLLRDAD